MGQLLSSREKTIIVYLITSLNPVTTQKIADEIHVSRRTILRDLPTVYKWFENQGQAISHHPKKGLFLPVDEQTRVTLKEKLSDAIIDTYYDPKERKTYIAVKLLQTNELYKLAYFSKVLFVSEATISHDLDKVEDDLVEYNLTLERKPGMGVRVIGNEASKRKALINFIYDSLNGNDLHDVINSYMTSFKKSSFKSKDIRTSLLELIDIDTIHVIEDAITESEDELGFKFAESSYTALAVHLNIALQRLQNGEPITIASEALKGLELLEEFSVAKRLAKSISKELLIDIPNEEIGYITMHLRGAKYHSGLLKNDTYEFSELMLSNYQLVSLINEMIRIAEDATGFPLKQSDSLLVGLVDHLRPAFNRLEMKLDIRNPLLDKIKSQYPDLFEISRRCADVVTKRMNIIMPDSEVGFIAMHIGSAIERIKNTRQDLKRIYKIVITCISGIGTSRMLAERLKAEFPNIDIVEVFSTTQINDTFLLENNIDLIVSTVHFDNKLLPIVTVNPLLLDNDIEKIKQKLLTLDILDKKLVYPKASDLNPLDILERLKQYQSAAGEILESLRCIDQYMFEDFELLLAVICENLTDDKVQAKRLKTAIIEREKIGQIIFDDYNLVVLHAKTEVIKSLQVGIYRNNTAVNYKDHSIKTVLVLLAPKSVTKEGLEMISEISSKLVSDQTFLDQLSTSSMDIIYESFKTMILSHLSRINHQLLG
ncbi:MAG: BglG family transcription antiterminator [Candidatus Izemoplasmataceae bacterium]